ncbi:MAG: hypothetical protein D6812_01175 [Deltaproteobacteria bacterium]|nr:MAG: hypothetical protein D6812_01175 [Deltaproteobacteria bacterium]
MKVRIVVWMALLMLFGMALGCTQESQNQLKRSIQNYTGASLRVTIYAMDGTPIKTYEGVDKVTTGRGERGDARPYIYFYDKNGKYVQTNMGYIAEEP